LGGTLAIMVCSLLAAYTTQSLSQSKSIASAELGAKTVTSYVELAKSALGKSAANLVFTLMLCASIGVCSMYLVFIGQTLESLSFDATSQNII
jgi:amino acid permease